MLNKSEPEHEHISEMTYKEYLIYIENSIDDEELDPKYQQHASHRPIRMYDAITAISDQLVNHKETSISYAAVNRGFILMDKNKTISRIKKINEYLGEVFDGEEDESLDSIRSQRHKNNTKQSYREAHYYCGKNTKKAISKLADPLGLNLGDVVQYLWLLGIHDHEFNPKIKKSLMKTLEELEYQFENRLANYERFAKRKGIDLSGIE
jgi:hypothetical protein